MLLSDEQIWIEQARNFDWGDAAKGKQVAKAQLAHCEPLITAKVAQEIFSACDEYIKLLILEINELVGLAWVHGWRSTRFEQGKKLREIIQALKAEYGVKE